MRSKLAAMLSLCLSAATLVPAIAADDKDLLSKSVDTALIVTRVGGVSTALVVGTPISIVRTTWDTWGESTPKAADHVGGKDCGPCNALASVYTIPLSLVMGATKGTYKGMSNAFGGFDKPFTPDSFSVGEWDKD